MPEFEYKARDKYGRAATGTLAGENEKEIVGNLRKMGYVPISVRPCRKELKLQLSKGITLFGKVKEEDMILFTRQLATLLKAGLPLLSGLDAISSQTNSRLLKDTIAAVMKDIEAGTNFSEALSRHRRIFPSLYVNMVKTGEASGLLDDIMTRLAELQEYDLEIKTKIKSAVRYPILALTALVAAFFVLVTFVIPRFAALFARFNLELPLPTRILLLIYEGVRNGWYVVLTAAAIIIFLFLRYINTPSGRKIWDTFKLRFPVFGPLLFKIYMARFARTTSILIASGINVLETLDLTADIVGNVVIREAVKTIREGVKEGAGLANPMKVSKLFTPLVVQMVAIGEETGKIDELLTRASEHYDQQVNYIMKNLTTLIEPMLIFLLGGMVTFVAVAIFLPMWNLVNIYKSGF